MPRVTQVCIPRSRTAWIISITLSRFLSVGLRQAAPMQKRLAPLSLAACAAAITSSSGSSFSRSSPVSYLALCEQ